MSLLSARHVSRANALIHSAYLSSICLHYNHTGIIGFPLCSQIGTFISESYTAQGSALSYSLHLKRIRRQARRLAHRPRPCKPQVLSPHFETKRAIVLHTEKLSRARREEEEEDEREEEAREEAACQPDRVCLKSDCPTLLCEISDDIKSCFFFPLL